MSYGLGVSGDNPTRAPILQEHFGTKNFGTVFGLNSIFITIASMVAPPLAGWLYDINQDYKLCWLIVFAIGILALISALTIPRARWRTK